MIDKKVLSEIKYIDRNKTLRYIEWYMLMKRRDYSNPTITLNEVMGLIMDIDVADVTEVKHGTWNLETNEEMPNPMFKLGVCSICKRKVGQKYNYCPYCGAKMDGMDGVE